MYEEAMSKLRGETQHVLRTLTLDLAVVKARLRVKDKKIRRLRALVKELQDEMQTVDDLFCVSSARP